MMVMFRITTENMTHGSCNFHHRHRPLPSPISPRMPALPECVLRSKLSLVRLGPSIVSWNGRMIQQMFLIEPLAKQIDTEVYFRVIWNGQSSATDSFRILTPKHLGVMSGGGM